MNRIICSVAIALAAVAACHYDSPSTDDDMTMGDDDDTQTPVCGDITADGVCAGNQLMTCVDDALHQETCDQGCSVTGGVAACNVVDCNSVGPLGRCDGEMLARCDATTSLVDCAATGQACAYLDDTTGYACVDPASLGSYKITGKIRWEDRPLSPGSLGAPVAKGARGVMVSILDDASSTTLASVSTADDGSYVAYYAATGDVRVVAYSRSKATARPARVRDAAGYLHALGGTAFAPGATEPVDLLVTADSTISGAWNALDNAVTAMDWLRARGIATIQPVYIYWQLGSATGSYYQGGDNSLHLDGDDGFDDVVTLHELGHYVQDEYSVSDNPGGSHDGSPADPRLAWGEGGATWFAIAVRGEPYYIDWSAGGGWSVELEDRVHAASMNGSMSQSISEWMVAEMLWDVGDGIGGDNDPMSATFPDVFGVLTGYMTGAHVSRGVVGANLVDFLDGWFMEQGMGSCAPMLQLVQGRYGFPYDFAGPAGVCP